MPESNNKLKIHRDPMVVYLKRPQSETQSVQPVAPAPDAVVLASTKRRDRRGRTRYSPVLILFSIAVLAILAGIFYMLAHQPPPPAAYTPPAGESVAPLNSVGDVVARVGKIM